jgi:carbamoyl-phosphate synthase large subunit
VQGAARGRHPRRPHQPEHRDGADLAKLADEVYFLPVEPSFVEQIIVRERIDAILLGFGGQSALNCGLKLADDGILARHGVRVLGTSIETIRACEDRKLFADKLREIAVPVARGQVATSLARPRRLPLSLAIR